MIRNLRIFLAAWWRWLLAWLRQPVSPEVQRRMDKWDGTR